VYIGKPAYASFEEAMAKFRGLGIDSPEKIVMCGDTPETDIRGANNFGMDSALILETGIMKDRQNEKLSDVPTYIIKRL
jgi:ribonucleotide monophosphatase NagD (HAD superfamily)